MSEATPVLTNAVDEKLTALADEVRELSGVTDALGLDDMTTNLDAANDEVSSQVELIAQLALALEGKASARPSLQDKVVTPATDEQVIRADSEYDGLKKVTVTGDPNLVSENIAEGVSIFGVEGTHTGGSGGSVETCTVHAKIWFNGGGDSAVTSMLMYTTLEDGVVKSRCEYPGPYTWENDRPSTTGGYSYWCYKDLVCVVGTDIYCHDGGMQAPMYEHSDNITINENAGDEWGTIVALTVNYNAEDSFLTATN